MKSFLYGWLLFAICFCPANAASYLKKDNGKKIDKKPIHLIWVGESPPWENDWIDEVLSKVKDDVEIVSDKDYSLFLDRSIIVVSIPLFPKEDKLRIEENCKRYFRQYKEKGLRFGIIHLSDEFYISSTEFYTDAKFVIRNYWHKKFTDDKILFFPLGYKIGFWKNFKGRLKNADKRNLKWSFAGQINKSTRLSMIDNMKKISNHSIHEIGSWNATNSLPTEEYRDLLLQSIFAPCPRGHWNLDSYRVWEALECGCIPIVEKGPIDYFGKVFGFHPFPSVATWEEAPALINHLLAHPKELEKRRKECYRWWTDYKSGLQEKVADLVEKELQ